MTLAWRIKELKHLGRHESVTARHEFSFLKVELEGGSDRCV